MQVNIEEISPVKRKVSVEVPADKVATEIEKTFANIQKKATLSGFRKGKAPIHMIKRFYHGAMQDEVMRRLYEQTLFPALEQHKIEPVDAPLIDEMATVEEGAAFKYTALVEIMPMILLQDYKGLQVKKEQYQPSPEAVEAEIERMRNNMAQLEPLEDGVVASGQVLTVDFSFKMPEHPEEETSGTDTQIEIGGAPLLPGLEEGITGMSIGDTRDVQIVFPEGHSKPEIAGKSGTFTITVKEIKKKDLPDLDDDFAQQFGDFDTMEDMRTKLSEMREKQELERISADFKHRVVDALIEKNPLDVPDSMVKRQLDFMIDNLKQRLERQRFTLEMMGMTEETLRQRYAAEAVQKVKGGLLVMALVEKENISVSDEDLEARYVEIAAGNDDMLPRIRDFYSNQPNVKNSLIAEIKEDKAIAFLIENAEISELPASDMQAGVE